MSDDNGYAGGYIGWTTGPLGLPGSIAEMRGADDARRDRQAANSTSIGGSGVGPAFGVFLLIILVFIILCGLGGLVRKVMVETGHGDPFATKAPAKAAHSKAAPFRPDSVLTQDVTFEILVQGARHLEQQQCTLRAGTPMKVEKQLPRPADLPPNVPDPHYRLVRFPPGACGADSMNYGTTLAGSALKPAPAVAQKVASSPASTKASAATRDLSAKTAMMAPPTLAQPFVANAVLNKDYKWGSCLFAKGTRIMDLGHPKFLPASVQFDEVRTDPSGVCPPARGSRATIQVPIAAIQPLS
jgi:hypothetical protein